MVSSTEKWLVRDDFLSDVFGILWLRVETPLSVENYEKVFQSVSDLPPGTKVDLPLDASETELAASLQRDGWYLGNTKTTYTRTPNPNVPQTTLPERVRIEPLNESHAATLVERVPSLFLLDRYRHDPNLDQTKVADLYHQWLSNNIEFRCDEILTATAENELLGFLCVIRESEYMYFELIGVFQPHQHKGIGKSLVSAAVRNYRDMAIRVVTQYHNIPMQRVLIDCGFKPVDAIYVFTIHV